MLQNTRANASKYKSFQLLYLLGPGPMLKNQRNEEEHSCNSPPGGTWSANIRGGAVGKSEKVPCPGVKFLKIIPCPGVKFS